MAELRAPEVARDHDTLDKKLKTIDKKYYTDDLLGRLTLNDKQFAVTIATVPDEPVGKKVEVVEGNQLLNPVEVDGVVVSGIEPQFGVPGPVAEEA